jgi:hypothetical protein
MARYKVKAPDGHIVELEGPDGASDADVMAQAQRLYTPPSPQAQSNPSNVAADRGFFGTLKDAADNAYEGAKSMFSQPFSKTVSDTGKSFYGTQKRQYDLGKAYMGAPGIGNKIEGAGHFMAGALPFVGPMAAEAGEAFGEGRMGEGAAKTAMLLGPFAIKAAVPRIVNAIPSATRAGKGFEAVMQGAGHAPIDTSKITPIVSRGLELGDRGASVPKVVSDFANHPQPVTYQAGRDFASNAGRLSATEAQAANPAMARQVALLAKALDEANEGAAQSAGLGNEYRLAMTEYRRAMQMRNAGKTAVKVGLGMAGTGLAAKLAREALAPPLK